MAVRTYRDWRGIKHHLSQFSTDEVLHLRDTAQQTSEQVARFILTLDTELNSRRNADPASPSAGPLLRQVHVRWPMAALGRKRL
jgi:hypothetical protein